MNWAGAGLLYALIYAVAVWVLGDRDQMRLLVGNAALLVSPLVPLAVLFRRRHDWLGREAVFWSSIGAWALLWFLGQIGWTADEVFRATPLPWFKWHIILQLSGSALPLIALVAWPHRGTRSETASTAAIDIAVLTFLTGFLYWSLIIAPGMDPAHSAIALKSLAYIGPSIRLTSVIGLLWAARSASGTAWSAVYLRLAGGMVFAFALLIILSVTTLQGSYQTGSPADVGWMLPFWFAAWAAATSAPSGPEPERIMTTPVRHASAALLVAAVIIVPVVGYGLRYLVPLGQPVDTFRDLATAFMLVSGMALVFIRLRVEARAVERAHERFRLLAVACEQAAELIVIVRGARFEYANDAFCRACGYTREETLSLDPRQLIASESQADVPQWMERIRNGQSVRSRTVLVRKDGSTFDAEWAASPMLDANGRVTHLIGVVRDLTEDNLLSDQLVRSERLSALGEFVSGAAHEINNPLQSVIGTLGVLLREPHEPASRDDLQRAQREAGRAGRIIRNLLAFVRKSADERLLVDLNEIIRSSLSVRAYEFELAGITLREEYATALPLVLANRDDIQQVLANLVINAQQSIADGSGRGTLTVRTAAVNDHAVLEVIDDGPGVPPESRGRLFEPFFTTRPPGEGTGLGLSIAFGIVSAHGGTLELVPSDGTQQGARFRITLPGAGFPGPAGVH